MPRDNLDRALAALVKTHRARTDEPLHLAVWLRDPRRPQDVIVFEVLGNFGGGHIDPNKRFLEVAMPANAAVPLPEGGALRFVLTSPEELKVAIAKAWPAWERLRDRYEPMRILYADAHGKPWAALLRAA